MKKVWARSSVVERLSDKKEVDGSIPSAPTHRIVLKHMDAKYRYLVRTMIALHLLWFSLALLSLPLVFTVTYSKIFISLFVVITFLSWIVWRGCILRILENKFRGKSAQVVPYEGTFARYYVKRVFGVYIPDRAVRMFITAYLLILLFLSLR